MGELIVELCSFLVYGEKLGKGVSLLNLSQKQIYSRGQGNGMVPPIQTSELKTGLLKLFKKGAGN